MVRGFHVRQCGGKNSAVWTRLIQGLTGVTAMAVSFDLNLLLFANNEGLWILRQQWMLPSSIPTEHQPLYFRILIVDWGILAGLRIVRRWQCLRFE